jgi:hypothetical protein
MPGIMGCDVCQILSNEVGIRANLSRICVRGIIHISATAGN